LYASARRLFKDKKPGEATIVYQQIIRSAEGPSVADAYYEMAICLAMKGDRQGEVSALEKALDYYNGASKEGFEIRDYLNGMRESFPELVYESTPAPQPAKSKKKKSKKQIK